MKSKLPLKNMPKTTTKARDPMMKTEIKGEAMKPRGDRPSRKTKGC